MTHGPVGLERLVAEICLAYLCSETCLRAREAHRDHARARKAVWPRFRDEFLDRFSTWTVEDFDGAVGTREWREIEFDAYSLLGTVTRGFRVEVELVRSEPVVPTRCMESFLKLSNAIDADTLIISMLKGPSKVATVSTLSRWGLVPRFSDRELDNLVARGVGDIHLHFGGARSAVSVWHGLLDGSLPLSRVSAFRRRVSNDRGASSDGDDATARIEAVVQELRVELSKVRRSSKEEGASSLAPASLNRERLLLAQRIDQLLAAKRKALSSENEVREFEDSDLDFHRILYAKARFMSELRHPLEGEGTGPGLGRFRKYFRSSELVDRLDRPIRRTPRFENIKLARRKHADVANLLRQSECLRKVELRLSPLPTIQHYARFFRIWEGIESEFKFRASNLDVRFAIHFMRSASRRRGNRNTASAAQQFKRELDFQTATLHLFRANRVAARLSDRIARIDLAGQERDLPVAPAVACMNLLRGIPAALDDLRGNVCHTSHRRWIHIRDSGRAAQPVHSRPLGVTCHAGEDMAHPLDGLCDMACAVEFLHMDAGDTLGHGLAAGWNLDAFSGQRARQTITRRGRQFDGLLWLHCQLMRQRSRDAATIWRLEQWLRREAAEIYPALVAQDIERLHPIFALRSRCVRDRSSRAISPAEQMLWLEAWESKCDDLRAMPVPIDPLLETMEEAIGEIQRSVVKTLIDRGIALEFNPSSNLRVAGSQAIEDAPFINLIKDFGEALLSVIGTDDPGTFATRIENEYAILLHGLVARGVSRSESLHLVDRIRKLSVGEHERPLVV